MQAADRAVVVSSQIGMLVLRSQPRGIERLESDEQAAQAGLDRLLQEARPEYGLDRAGGLPDASHAAHALEQCSGKAGIPQQVVVEKI